MNRKLYLVICILFFINDVFSVPPEACFSNFNWDDCGKPPVPVMYYWKPGSRCEVGLWRGCLPNLNMFQDEYECVSTCIFTIRAMPEDYHNLLVPEDQEVFTIPLIETTTDIATDGRETASTTVGGESENVTTVTGVTGESTGETGTTGDSITTTT